MFVSQAMNASELSTIPMKKPTSVSLDEDILEDDEENEETDDDHAQHDNPSAAAKANLERSLSCNSADATKK
jgi:hypothetical protein